MTSEIKHLDELVAVHILVSIWSGARRLSKDDLGLAADVDLPPEKLASLGSKKVFDPESLKVFNKLKARAHNKLAAVGVRFLGGYAIPESRVQETLDFLKEVEEEFNEERRKFLDNYDLKLQEWIEDNQEWGWIVQKAALSANDVRGRIAFGHQFYRVAPPAPGDPTSEGLAAEVAGLGKTLYDEVAKKAANIWDKSLKDKTEITRKALRPILAIYEKLDGLSFLDPDAVTAMDLIKTTMDAIPNKGGKLTGASLLMIQGLVRLLMSPSELSKHCEMVHQGQAPGEVMSGWALDAVSAKEWATQQANLMDDTSCDDVPSEPAPTPEPSALAEQVDDTAGVMEDASLPEGAAQGQELQVAAADEDSPRPSSSLLFGEPVQPLHEQAEDADSPTYDPTWDLRRVNDPDDSALADSEESNTTMPAPAIEQEPVAGWFSL